MYFLEIKNIKKKPSKKQKTNKTFFFAMLLKSVIELLTKENSKI